MYVSKHHLRCKAGSENEELEPEGPAFLTQPETESSEQLPWGCESGDGTGKRSFPQDSETGEHSNQERSNRN